MELTILAGSTAKIPFHGFRQEYVEDYKELPSNQVWKLSYVIWSHEHP